MTTLLEARSSACLAENHLSFRILQIDLSLQCGKGVQGTKEIQQSANTAGRKRDFLIRRQTNRLNCPVRMLALI